MKNKSKHSWGSQEQLYHVRVKKIWKFLGRKTHLKKKHTQKHFSSTGHDQVSRALSVTLIFLGISCYPIFNLIPLLYKLYLPFFSIFYFLPFQKCATPLQDEKNKKHLWNYCSTIISKPKITTFFDILLC